MTPPRSLLALLSVILLLGACGAETAPSGACVPVQITGPDNQPLDLSGVWSGNDTGLYYIKQIDSCVWWSGVSNFADQGQYPGEEWIMTFRGTINSDGVINGDFVDVKSYVSNGFWKHDVEDNAYALMKDARGRIAMLHSTATQWQHRFVMEIALTDGYLELRGILSGTKSYGQERLIVGRRVEAETGSPAETVITYLDDKSWAEEIAEFAAAMTGQGRVEEGTSADALAVMKLVYRIYWEDPDWRAAFNIPFCG